jgi:hypothetical protein
LTELSIFNALVCAINSPSFKSSYMKVAMKDAFHEQFAKKLIIYRILLNSCLPTAITFGLTKRTILQDKKDSGFEITTKLVPFHSFKLSLGLQIYQNFG